MTLFHGDRNGTNARLNSLNEQLKDFKDVVRAEIKTLNCTLSGVEKQLVEVKTRSNLYATIAGAVASFVVSVAIDKIN